MRYISSSERLPIASDDVCGISRNFIASNNLQKRGELDANRVVALFAKPMNTKLETYLLFAEESQYPGEPFELGRVEMPCVAFLVLAACEQVT